MMTRMILVGAFEDPVHAHVAQIALDPKILEIPVTAVQLQRLVGDAEPDIGGQPLRHRAMQCCVGCAGIDRKAVTPRNRISKATT